MYICYSSITNNFQLMACFMMSTHRFLYFSLLFLIFSFGNLYAQDSDTSKRPFYEYKGNYGEEVVAKKSKFKSAFGYNLIDLGETGRQLRLMLFMLLLSNFRPGFTRYLL